MLAIEAKYGMSLTAACLEDVKSIYGTFVEAVVPPGDALLTGGEAPLIQVRAGGGGGGGGTDRPWGVYA